MGLFKGLRKIGDSVIASFGSEQVELIPQGATVNGITDGVAIAAGKVGEVITSNGSMTWALNTYTEIANITLSPGLWMLRAFAYQGSGTGQRRLDISITTTSGTAGSLPDGTRSLNAGWHDSSGTGSVQINGLIVNISVADVYYLNAETTSTSGGAGGSYIYQAVRIA